ncbi:MAG: NAD(P)/FAD-dependent oxidoreductase [Candidatus Bathyarchaeia archaeon]
MVDFDAIVVGGGPAGATTAITCSKLGLEVLLVERGDVGRRKPCGGVLPPICADEISDAVGRGMPERVMCSPRELGLYYVPPSGMENGGRVRNYRLLNVNRDSLDQWLRDLAEEEGAQIRYETSFIGFKQLDRLQVVLGDKDGGTVKMTTRYLIGADGVYSRVRRQLYGAEDRFLHVMQEHLKAEGDFEDCFYAVFRGEISPTYGYIIPKDGLLVVGVGVPQPCSTSIFVYINRFKEWLTEEFAFKQTSLERREVWAIPYGFVRKGVGDVLLVGDAAGLCNPLSGEGVRLAIKSGEAAGNSILEAVQEGKAPSVFYNHHIEHRARFLRRIHRFASSLTDEGREAFVKSELSRVSLY